MAECEESVLACVVFLVMLWLSLRGPLGWRDSDWPVQNNLPA